MESGGLWPTLGLSSRTLTRRRRKKYSRCSTSPSTGSNSLAGVPDASAVTTWPAAAAARSRMASKSFTRLPFLKHFVDVPVLQITDEPLNEADAAVRGSGEGGGWRRRRWRSAPDAAPWHDRRYADTTLKTVEARRWVGAHHLCDELM